MRGDGDAVPDMHIKGRALTHSSGHDVDGESSMRILDQALLHWLISGAIMLGVWLFGWAEPISTASTAGEPTGDMAFIGAHVLACLVVGFLIPPLAKYTGPIALAAAIVWIVVHVATYDGSQGASFWPLALIMIVLSMPVLSVFGLLGQWLRKRIDRAG